ncbi:hypothetical protein Bca101_027597 [Brassica carinata]
MAMEKQIIVGEVPVSPFSLLFSMPGLDCFNIVTIGFKHEANPSVFIEGLKNTLLNHPRFSSILEMGLGENKAKWIPTKVKVEDHVVFPEIDPTIENPDQFLEDYTSNMVFSPIDMSKPLWEMHILNIKTSDAESLVVARFHHSLGDGMSLMSLLLACSRKTNDPEALPTLVAPKLSKVTNVWWSLAARLWLIMRRMFNTVVEVFKFLLILCSVCENGTPLTEKPSATRIPNKFIHRVISLNDVKVVKNAMNMTVNDVILGMVQAGLSRYLSHKNGGSSGITRDLLVSQGTQPIGPIPPSLLIHTDAKGEIDIENLVTLKGNPGLLHGFVSDDNNNNTSGFLGDQETEEDETSR